MNKLSKDQKGGNQSSYAMHGHSYQYCALEA